MGDVFIYVQQCAASHIPRVHTKYRTHRRTKLKQQRLFYFLLITIYCENEWVILTRFVTKPPF